MSFFGDAIGNAVSSLEDMSGELITYIANEVQHVDIMAIPGKEVSVESPTGGKTTVSARGMAWMIERSKLPVHEPLRGHLIVREDGRRYRVAPLDGHNTPCWRWSGPYESYFRIQVVSVDKL